MRKKLLATIVAVLLAAAAVLAVGCSDPFVEGEDGVDEVANKVTITVGVLNEPGERETMRKFKKAFEETNDQINIRIRYFQGTYEQGMSTFIQKPEDMPDIVWTGAEKHAPFSSAGHFVDLAPYYARSEETSLNKYYDTMIETTHYSSEDKGIWYAPRDYNKPVTFINRTMIEAAGLKVPSVEEWNYQTFLKLCEDLRAVMDNEADNTEEQRKAGLLKNSVPCDGDLIWSPNYISYVSQYGGTLVDGKTVGIKSDECMDAYKEMHRVVSERLISNPQTDTADSFLKKGAAMWFTVRPRLQAVIGAGIDVDFLPLPFEHVAAGNSGYAITTQATKRVSSNIEGNTKSNAEYAWEFIKFIITEPGQEVFGETGTGIPVLRSLATTGKWLQYHDPDLHHEVFIGTEEEDVNVDIFVDFPPDDQYEASQSLNGLFSEVGRASSWSNGEPGAGFMEELNKVYNTLTEFIA